MTSLWLTRQEAARRVHRSERTIARWEDRGLVKRVLERYSEQELLKVDLHMREARAHAGERLRQPKPEPMPDVVKRLGDEIARQIHFADPLGEGEWMIDVTEVDGNRFHLRAEMRYRTAATRAHGTE